jgi:hypothetical protein
MFQQQNQDFTTLPQSGETRKLTPLLQAQQPNVGN